MPSDLPPLHCVIWSANSAIRMRSAVFRAVFDVMARLQAGGASQYLTRMIAEDKSALG